MFLRFYLILNYVYVHVCVWICVLKGHVFLEARGVRSSRVTGGLRTTWCGY